MRGKKNFKLIINIIIIIFIILSIYFMYKILRIKESFANRKNINIYLSYSKDNTKFGDALFILIYFYNNKEYILENNIQINYYIRSEYLENLIEFNCCPNNIKFYDIDDKPNDAIDVWIGGPWKNNAFSKLIPNKMAFNEYLPLVLSEMGEKMGLQPIHKFVYEDLDLINRYNNLDYIYRNLDILIINGSGGSAGVTITKEEWEIYVRKLNNKYSIITSEKVDDILCTRDNNFRIKDIAAISTNVKYIITINTGPFISFFNKYTLENVKKWYVFDNTTFCSGDNFINVKTFDEIDL
jgi:hypothetical protein